MRTRLALLTCAVVMSAPGVALAQADCPPGSWFCEEPAAQPDADVDGDDADVGAEPDAESDDTPAKKSKPPIVVYQPAGEPPDKIIVVDRHDAPKPARRRFRREWGFNIHLQSVLMGDRDERHEDSGMSGLGFSFRYRPIPHFAFDAGVDFLAGVDFQGQDRRETALLLNAMVFFNPRSKLQVYTIGGLGFSGAHVQRNSDIALEDGTVLPAGYEANYSYFGAQLGLGLEWRVGRKIALDFDVIGFIRGRTDELARTEPEFVDASTGRATNTSGGGLGRLGVTFYW